MLYKGIAADNTCSSAMGLAKGWVKLACATCSSVAVVGLFWDAFRGRLSPAWLAALYSTHVCAWCGSGGIVCFLLSCSSCRTPTAPCRHGSVDCYRIQPLRQVCLARAAESSHPVGVSQFFVSVEIELYQQFIWSCAHQGAPLVWLVSYVGRWHPHLLSLHVMLTRHVKILL
jgi:hypothetical protein